MGATTEFKISVLASFIVFISACGDVYEGDDASNKNSSSSTTDPSVATSTNDTGSAGTSGTDTNDTDTNIDVSLAVSSARARFETSDCGSLPISAALPSNDRSTPTIISTQQLVSGRIAQDSDSNYEHFWRIALEAGSYNLVFDSETVSGDYRYLSTKMTDLSGTDPDGDDVLISFDESNYRVRAHEFIVIDEPRTLDLMVTTTGIAEDYRFAIFENGSPVPSPLFIDCPSIMSIGLDTTEAISLPRQVSAEQDRWYQVELEAKNYVLNSRATSTDCETGGIEYEISHADQFGQKSRMTDHERVVEEAANNITGSASLKSLESGPVWIRIQNHDCALNLEFTISAEG